MLCGIMKVTRGRRGGWEGWLSTGLIGEIGLPLSFDLSFCSNNFWDTLETPQEEQTISSMPANPKMRGERRGRRRMVLRIGRQ